MSSPNHWRLRSVKGTHFTTTLAQDALDLEDIGALPVPGVHISRITLLSDQNLDWDIMLFRSSDGTSSNADLDTMLGWYEFLAADAVQSAGFGLYRYFKEVSLRYRTDDDRAHVGLINRSVTGKNAGVTGEFVVELSGSIETYHLGDLVSIGG